MERICHACSSPPLRDGNDQPIKMLRCSRCKNAWYHNVKCQRNHYKKHKEKCHLDATKETEDKRKEEQLKYRCEVRKNHGKSMIASTDIPEGTRICCPLGGGGGGGHDSSSTSNIGDQGFQSIVPPVLVASDRQSRCSVCFQSLTTILQIGNIFNYCSMRCKQKGGTFDSKLMQCFEYSSVVSKSRAEQICTPVTILVFRILSLLHSEEIMAVSVLSKRKARQAMDQLTANDNNDDNDEDMILNLSDDELKYRQHVARNALLLYHNTHEVSEHMFTVDQVITITSQIIYNGFSITNGEQQTIGTGLYTSVSIINHSCMPNLVQTFAYGNEGETPTLLLTSCESISKNDECFIAYTNVLDVYEKRRDFLRREYKFLCDCYRCTQSISRRKNQQTAFVEKESIGIEKDYDSMSEVLFCSTKNCNEYCFDYRIPKCCKNCRCENAFHVSLTQREEGMNIISQRDKKSSKYSDRMENARESLKLICHKKSWYNIESGEILVDCLLTQIGYHDDDYDRRICSKALSILEEIESNIPIELNHTMLRLVNGFKIGKLLLYLDHDPRRAIVRLQGVRSRLLLYYPKEHEIIRLVDESLMSAYT